MGWKWMVGDEQEKQKGGKSSDFTTHLKKKFKSFYH